jgi:hypothetical protein
MAIRFQCDCGKKYSVDDSFAGRTSRCKVCWRPLSIPAFVPAQPTIDVKLQPGRKNRRRSTSSSVPMAILTIPIVSAFAAVGVVGYISFRSNAPSISILDIIIRSIVMFLAIGFPLTALMGPVALSILRCLSVGRWPIMAALMFLLACISGAVLVGSILLGGSLLDPEKIVR